MTHTFEDKNSEISTQIFKVSVNLFLFGAGLVSIVSGFAHINIGTIYIIPIIEILQSIIMLLLWVYANFTEDYKNSLKFQMLATFIGLSLVLLIGGEKFIPNYFMIGIISPAAIMSGFKFLSLVIYILACSLFIIYINIHSVEASSHEMIYLFDAFLFTSVSGFITVLMKRVFLEARSELEKFRNKIAIDNQLALEKRITNVTAELHESQKQLILSEKMVSLGVLLSSVAHEINTPIASIKASSKNITLIFNEIIKNLELKCGKLDENIIKLFIELTSAKVNRIDLILTTREERESAERISDKLMKLGVDAPYEVCEAMAPLNVEGNLEYYLPIFKHESSELILRQLIYVCDAISNSANIIVSVDMVSKIVFALKSFSHTGENLEYSYFNTIESIETVLTIYQNKTKNSVKIVRKFQGDPKIYGVRDEMQQVWINLIHNSLQAMDFNGTLTITVSETITEVNVSIEDTGTGIDESLRNKIFEPFFTTKSVGEGSGLGLNIVKKIVEKHKGTISFTSIPGNTNFLVVIPKPVT